MDLLNKIDVSKLPTSQDHINIMYLQDIIYDTKSNIKKLKESKSRLIKLKQKLEEEK